MKKILSSLLVLAMVVACLSTAVFAAGSTTLTGSTETLTVSDEAQTVTVTFSVDNATFNTYGMFIKCNAEGITLTSLTNGNVSGMFVTNTANGFVTLSTDADVNLTGTLFTATFQVAAGTPAGEYPVVIDLDYIAEAQKNGPDGKPMTPDELDLDVKVVNGLIKIEEEPGVHTHSWSAWEVTTAPTCTEAGVETRTCACGESETREVAALGHDFGEWTVTTEATCEKAGVETRTCSRCGETETREVAALGHAWGEWTVTTEATCTEAGVETRTCANCGATETREIAAKGHTWGEWEVTTEATCKEAGVETRTCACGATETREIAALGHDWTDWVVVKEPTTEEEGLKQRECRRCGEIETQSIDKLGKDPVPETGDITAPFMMAGTLVLVMMAAIYFFVTKRQTVK